MKDATPLKAKKPWTGRQWAYFLGYAWPRGATNAWRRTVCTEKPGRLFTRHFHTLGTHRRGEKALNYDWESFADGIMVAWSQGPVESLNNRTKLMMMYGRAALTPLHARILHR